MNKRKNGRKSGKNRVKKLVGLSVLAASAMGVAMPAAFAQNFLGNCAPIIFGSVTACAGAGTVTIDPAGNRTTGGCTTVSGPSSRGRCFIRGSNFPFRPVQVSITTPTVTITNGTTNMNVNGFDLNTAGNGPTVTVTALLFVVRIGATLNIGANQAGGSYAGTVTINANFQ